MKQDLDLITNNAVLQLKEQEVCNPQLALSAFFSTFDLGQCRYLLREHFEKNNPVRETCQVISAEPHDIFQLQLVLLIEASYLLHLASQKKNRPPSPEEPTALASPSPEVPADTVCVTDYDDFRAEALRVPDHPDANPFAQHLPPAVWVSVEAFFDALSPATFKRTFFGILTAYAGTTFYSQGNPVEVLFTLEKLKDLICSLALLPKPPATTLATGGSHPDNRTAPCPGTLNDTDRENPLPYLYQFSQGRPPEEWTEILDSLQHFALCSESGVDEGDGLDTLGLYHELVSVVEAGFTLYKLAGGRLKFTQDQQ
ncbi:hypothetical protein GCM10023091_08640 [Ravibacter arvi]|uniref:Uncharacterized protein n=1 Tax=Ravibacter arvi TaxID=2051041 RepID=A0ABP8LRZ5_9BACT